MAVLLVLKHSADEGPGRLGATLRDHAFKLDIRRVDLGPEAGGDPMPRDMDDYAGLISLGGPQDPTEDLPFIDDELSLIRQAHEREMPVIGICLGHQLVARALGGELSKMETPEWGLRDVSLSFPGQTESILAGIPWDHPQFHTHAFEVSKAPAGATVLAGNDRCKIQAFRAGVRTFGFQYHFEWDKPFLRGLAERESDQMRAAGLSVEAFEEQLAAGYGRYVRHAERLCVNLTTLSFNFGELTRA
ncbi:MAG: type 1 glutamine amidotransferase [Planctomycetota bacterium]